MSPEVYEAQRRVERRFAAAVNVPEPTPENPLVVEVSPDQWRLAFAGTGLCPESVSAALVQALAQMEPHGAVGACFWLGYELGSQA